MEIQKIKQITKKQAEMFVKKHHYRKIMPKLNKLFYGGFFNNELVGIMALGWGTQPDRTIKKLFPSLGSKDYYEIGRLCLIDELPKNSESNFISRIIKKLKQNKNLKVLFSWSDGIMGKPGFVYQCSNFLYAGKIKTDIYVTKEGYLIHPRSARKLLEINADYIGKEKLFWLTQDFMDLNEIIRLKGSQFRYVYFVCSNKERKQLIGECKIELNKDYPKMKDILFYRKIEGKYKECEFPFYKETLSAEEVSRAIRCVSNTEGMVQFHHSASNQTTLSNLSATPRTLPNGNPNGEFNRR